MNDGTTITPAQLDAIEAGAKAATQGEWHVGGSPGCPHRGDSCDVHTDDCISVAELARNDEVVDDARHIAALSPPVAIALVALAREALERRVIDDHSLHLAADRHDSRASRSCAADAKENKHQRGDAMTRAELLRRAELLERAGSLLWVYTPTHAIQEANFQLRNTYAWHPWLRCDQVEVARWYRDTPLAAVRAHLRAAAERYRRAARKGKKQ